jgi:DNA polymerase-3 subunit gamma/tau
MLNAIGEIEIRFKRSGQQQLLVEILLVRFALHDRTVALEDVLKAIGDGGRGGVPGGGSKPPMENARSAGSGRPTAPPIKGPTSAVPVQKVLARDVAVDVQPSKEIPAIPDLNAITEKWDELVTRFRASGKALLAAALESSAPHAITARGDLTIKLDEPNDFHARAIEQASADVLTLLGDWFSGIERILLHRDDVPKQPGEKPKRVTDEMLRSERLNTLRRRDPTLDAAIDVLDLEIAE